MSVQSLSDPSNAKLSAPYNDLASLGSTSPSLVPTLDTSRSSHNVSFSPNSVSAAPAMVVAVVAQQDVIPRTISIAACQIITILEVAGGSDKDPESGHRRDTIPIRQAILETGCQAEVVQFQEEFWTASFENSGQTNNDTNDNAAANAAAAALDLQNSQARAHNDALRLTLMGMGGTRAGVVAGVIVRNNPGTLSTTSQLKLDALLVELDQLGSKVMSHPEVVRRMGAKDALCKIRHLRCGLEDTNVYYDQAAFIAGFCKTIAFRPRVMKQNRGSQGEGIWICKLKDETQYCERFGDRTAAMNTRLVLVEANDNHVEEHTVAEFLEFCINGRTAAAGEWNSTGDGQYLAGGYEAGAMLVDQRFLPRIVEGEVRCMMVGPNLVELIHKKPKEGGLSATLQSGATYTGYNPDDPEFANLVANFKHDLPSIMASFGMENQPLPLLWTADYIFGDKDKFGRDTFYVGEFNCSCVGITQQLQRADIVAQTAVETVFPVLAAVKTVTKSAVARWSLDSLHSTVLAGAAAAAILAVSVSMLGARKV